MTTSIFSLSNVSCTRSYGFPLLVTKNSPRISLCKVLNAAESEKENVVQTASEEPSKPVQSISKKPVYSMKKGQIVRVDKEKYLNSINYLSVGHPPYYKGLDYIYEDRGEVAWVGIPTAPAWLPTDMLIKSDKLDYERL